MIDLVNCIERHPLPSLSATKSLPYPSISLRSARIPAPKPSVAQRVATALAELAISTKLILPTKENVDRLDALQTALGGLVEMKKMVDRAEGELGMMRKRKELLSGIVAEEKAAKEAATAGDEVKTAVCLFSPFRWPGLSWLLAAEQTVGICVVGYRTGQETSSKGLIFVLLFVL